MISLANQDLPSEQQRTEAYNAELVRRYLTGQFLTVTDKLEARALIAAIKTKIGA